ncbi:transmembrane protein [Rhynchospora pubera]|uniref:Transmembrane protein n=1 Tax=Rhynchospora pubera TaxID=906938 RepID=A0AAV8DYW0_9POAL|nr:transmembrane protein [Rhynchospora pubera]
MKCVRCFCFFVLLVVFAIAPQATSSNNTTNVIHMFPHIIANATKETVTKLNETSKSNESGDLNEIPLRQGEALIALNNSKRQDPQNGEWDSFSNVEECDPSNRCVDQKEIFIACLRVPGTDSLALSLLIENNGTDSLYIEIVAPAFVNLEHSQVQLEAKEHKKVKVYLTEGAKDTTILLRSQESHCSLNLRNTLILEPPRTPSLYIHLLTRFTIICILLAVTSLIVLAYLFVKFRRSHSEVGLPYQRLDMELPVSTGGGTFSERGPENWNNWGDVWLDEEAPLTPSKSSSKPLSKGLNPRKFSKEGWKT